MNIDIITVLPQLLESPFEHSIIKRAIDKKIVEINIHNLRDFTTDKHHQVDDYQYGGGSGMVLMVEPIFKAINYLKSKRQYKQKTANELSTKKNIIILCGHYKGIDQRVRDNLITREISIGDYVLTGGELAAVLITDSIVRLIPGAISDETSALSDSFQDNLLAPPVYTRPQEFNGWKVPEILLSGHEKKIDDWRLEKAIEITNKKRPDLK